MTDFKLELGESVEVCATTSPNTTHDQVIGGIQHMLRWTRRRLTEGAQVYCVRSLATGLVQTFIAGDLSRWEIFDNHPLDEFTLTPMRLDEHGVVAWGHEGRWREVACAQAGDQRQQG